MSKTTFKDSFEKEFQAALDNQDWIIELKELLNNQPVILMEEHSKKDVYCVSFGGLEPKKKELFRFSTKKKADNLMACISEVVITELYKYHEYLIEEQKTNVKQSDLENYL